MTEEKQVKVIDIATAECNVYDSIIECERQTGVNRGTIWNCLKGRRKQAGGYVFKYAN